MEKYLLAKNFNRLFILSALMLLLLPLSAQVNLINNPGFSNGTQGWSTSCSIEINPENVYGGVLSTNSVSEIDIERCFYQDISVTPGATYMFSFKAARRTAGAPQQVGISVTIEGLQSAYQFVQDNKTYSSASWLYTTEYYSFTIPVNSTDQSVRVRFDNYLTPGTYGTVIDDIMLMVDSALFTLPVKVIDFSAVLQQKNAILNWKAVNDQQDGKIFIIERKSSDNGFDSIGQVAVHPVTNKYSFTDRTVPEGINQYRLKVIHQNGSYFYSKIVSIVPAISNELNFYPNPATSTLTCSINSSEDSDVFINMYNPSGMVVMQRQVHIHKGQNSISLDINALKAGNYYIRMADTKGIYLVKGFSKR